MTASSARLPPRDLALVLCVVALWGFNFVPIRWALDEVPPLALAALRFLLAAIPAVFFVKRPQAPWGLVVAYGLAIGVGQFGLLFLGIALGMPAGLASLVAQAQVFFTIGLAALLLRDRVSPRQLAGALVAACGIGLLAWLRIESGASATALGLVLTILAALSWGFGNVLAKHAAKRRPQGAPALDMFSLVVWSSLAAPLPLAALSYLFEGGAAPLHAIATMSLRAWASTVFMALGATLFGFAAWNRLLHRHPTGTIAPFALLIPIFGIASAWIVLGETLSWADLAAGALVVAGLALIVIAPSSLRRQRAYEAPPASLGPMSFRSWWLESKLNRMESKLRQKRGLLRRAREKEAREGADKAKLHAERERLTREINHLIVEEEHVKRELVEIGSTNQAELRARP